MPGFLENPFGEAFSLEREEELEKKPTDKQEQPESEEV